MADSEDQINLKKRARRRLVGAIALVTFVVIALPMVFDKESKPLSRDISVQIPNPDSGTFQHKAVPIPPPSATFLAPQNAPAPTVAPNSASPSAQSSPMPAKPAPPASSPPQAAAPAPAAMTPATPAATATEKKSSTKEASAKQSSAKAPPEASAAPAPAQAKSAEAGPLATGAGTKGAAKPASAPAAAPAKSGPQQGAWVVKMGAFADTANVQRLQSQLSAAGFKSYTEIYDSSKGPRTRVRAGPFATRAAAERAREKLKKLGLDGAVGEK